MTDQQLVSILNKNQINIEELSLLVDSYCSDTGRSQSDFTKIMDFTLHIPGLLDSAFRNITEYYKKKFNIVAVGDTEGVVYFYQSLN